MVHNVYGFRFFYLLLSIFISWQMVSVSCTDRWSNMLRFLKRRGDFDLYLDTRSCRNIQKPWNRYRLVWSIINEIRFSLSWSIYFLTFLQFLFCVSKVTYKRGDQICFWFINVQRSLPSCDCTQQSCNMFVQKIDVQMRAETKRILSNQTTAFWCLLVCLLHQRFSISLLTLVSLHTQLHKHESAFWL